MSHEGPTPRLRETMSKTGKKTHLENKAVRAGMADKSPLPTYIEQAPFITAPEEKKKKRKRKKNHNHNGMAGNPRALLLNPIQSNSNEQD